MTSAIICLVVIAATADLRAEDTANAKDANSGKEAKRVQQPLGQDWRIPEDKSKFHVFVLYGQSNMAGGIKERFGGTLTEEEKTPARTFSR